MDNKRFSLIMDNDKKSLPSSRIIAMLSMHHSVGHITSCCSPVQIEPFSTLANELLRSLRYTENTQLIALFDAQPGFHAYYMLKVRSSCMLVCTMPIPLFFLLPVVDSTHIAHL